MKKRNSKRKKNENAFLNHRNYSKICGVCTWIPIYWSGFCNFPSFSCNSKYCEAKKNGSTVPFLSHNILSATSDIIRFHVLNSVKFQLIHSIENDLLCFFSSNQKGKTHTHKHITRANIIDPIKCCSLAIASISPSSSHSNNKMKKKRLRKSTNRMSTKKPIW